MELKSKRRGRSHNELDGKLYGSWLVLHYAHMHGRNAQYICKCLLCNDKYLVFGCNLLSGTSTKCRRCSNQLRVRREYA